MLFRRTPASSSFAAAAIVLSSVSVLAQDSDPAPGKIRILSSRTATFEPSAGDVVARRKAEAAAARTAAVAPGRPASTPAAPVQRRSVPPAQKAELSPFMQAQQRGAANSNRPVLSAEARNPPPAAARGSAPQPSEEQRLRDEAARRESKLAAVRLGSTSPMNVGVPRASGGTSRPTLPAVGQQHAAAAAVAPPAAEPPPPTAPVPGRNPALSSSDPLLAEVVRDGSDYYFRGTINGQSARFRIREQISGIQIPVRMAVELKIVGSVPNNLPRDAEWVTPIQSLFFGANPVHAVMARIVHAGDAIDVGADALAAFRISNLNGRNFLVLGARQQAASI